MRETAARFGGGGAVGEARVEAINEGGCESVGSGFRYLESRLLQTTKFLPPYATELPTSPSGAPLRAISAAFLPVPAGGPEGFSRPGRTARLGRRREKARGLEAQAAVLKAKANAEVGKSGEASLAQPYVHRSKLPLRGSFPCISPGRQPANMELEGGVGVRRETTRRGYFRVQWGRWELSFQHPSPCSLPK